MIRWTFALVFVFSLPLSPLRAADQTRAGLVDAVAIFDAAISRNDFVTVIDLVPDKVFGEMARELAVSSEDLPTLVAEQMERVLEDVKILEFGVEIPNVAIEKTAGGVAYAFLPTRTVIEIHGARVETNSHTLALNDNDGWGLVRIDDEAQLRVLQAVYPDFSEVVFPQSTTKLIN